MDEVEGDVGKHRRLIQIHSARSITIILFLLGALIVRSIPALAGPVSDMLDNMRHGSVPMTLATLIINGVGEELFFRDVARRALADASSPTPHSSPRLLSTSPSPLPWAHPCSW